MGLWSPGNVVAGSVSCSTWVQGTAWVLWKSFRNTLPPSFLFSPRHWFLSHYMSLFLCCPISSQKWNYSQKRHHGVYTLHLFVAGSTGGPARLALWSAFFSHHRQSCSEKLVKKRNLFLLRTSGDTVCHGQKALVTGRHLQQKLCIWGLPKHSSDKKQNRLQLQLQLQLCWWRACLACV